MKYFVGFIIMMFIACGNPAPAEKEVSPATPVVEQKTEATAKDETAKPKKKKTKAPPPTKAELTEKYMKTFVEFPATQEEKDNNKIIKFAIDNELVMDISDSGLYHKLYPYGSGRKLVRGDAINVQYTGYFLDGTILESTLNSGGPAAMQVGSSIAGWTEMLLEMRMGDKAKVIIPSHLAYGSSGRGEKIPPDSPLFFDIEVMSFVKG